MRRLTYPPRTAPIAPTNERSRADIRGLDPVRIMQPREGPGIGAEGHIAITTVPVRRRDVPQEPRWRPGRVCSTVLHCCPPSRLSARDVIDKGAGTPYTSTDPRRVYIQIKPLHLLKRVILGRLWSQLYPFTLKIC